MEPKEITLKQLREILKTNGGMCTVYCVVSQYRCCFWHQVFICAVKRNEPIGVLTNPKYNNINVYHGLFGVPRGFSGWPNIDRIRYQHTKHTKHLLKPNENMLNVERWFAIHKISEGK